MTESKRALNIMTSEAWKKRRKGEDTVRNETDPQNCPQEGGTLQIEEREADPTPGTADMGDQDWKVNPITFGFEN